MVKVQVEATELRNGEIEKISLVKHGAIRQPFKILKTDEIPQDDAKVGDKLRKFFSATEEGANVAAVFVRKTAAKKWLPLIKQHGFTATKENAELDGDMIVLKQESFDPEVEGSMVALTPDVAIMLNRVVKGFDPYSTTASFDDNVKATAFYPGMYHALESLAETVWTILYEASSQEEAAAEVTKQVKAFGNYVNNMVGELPGAVFKMESDSLTKEFAGSNVSNSNSNVTKSEDDMTTTLREAAAGDLDGLLDEAPAADRALAKADAKAETAVEKEEATIVFLDADGNEISEEDFDALEKGGDMKKKGKKGYRKADGTIELAKGDEGAPKSGGSPGNAVIDSTSDTGAVSLDEGGVPEGMHGFRKEERTIKSLEGGKMVEKTAVYFVNDETKEEVFGGFVEKSGAGEAGQAANTATVSDGAAGDNGLNTNRQQDSEYSDAEVKLFEALGVMAKSMTEMKETVEKVASRVDGIEKTANSAKETAESTVVMGVAADLDESLATLSGHQPLRKSAPAGNVEKSEGDIFKGLLPGIEGAAQ